MKFEKLGNIATIKTGKYDVNHSTPDGEYVFYTCAYGQFKSPTYSFEGPAIILPGNGANVGEVFFYDGKFEAYQRTYVVQNFKADPNYIYAYFKAEWKKSLHNKQFGSATNYIRLNNLTDFSIPLPSLPDQLHIANILSNAENLIAQRKESIRLLDDFLKSTFLEMFGDASTNKNKFQKGTIRDVVSEVKYGTSSPAEEEGLYPYLRMNNITPDGYMDYSKLKYINIVDQKEKEKYVVRKGDLLFNRTNSKELVGKTGVFNEDSEMIIAGYLIRIRTNEKANPWFLWGYLNSIHGKQTLLGMCKSIVGMANINAQELQGIKILIPPIELQTQFAQIVEKTEALKTQYQQSLQELENLYGSLSKKAFRGELSINKNQKAVQV
ncbi:MAG: restriction endonuclease subunit S [Saprospiraceae bacterium]|nr:restriction endonuclease subunit S [Saprospiraceae bacterium]